jgi:hypothetical protein
VADVIGVFSNAQRWSCATRSVAASEGKKTEKGTMTSLPEPEANLVTVADPPEAKTSTPATTKQSSDIGPTAKSRCEIGHKI